MLRFAELALEAGLPPGVLNVVVGGATTGSALVGHPGVDKISFTGGSDTARTLMETAARNLTPLALELGGKSPNVVFPDADLDRAAAMAAHLEPRSWLDRGVPFPLGSTSTKTSTTRWWERSWPRWIGERRRPT